MKEKNKGSGVSGRSNACVLRSLNSGRHGGLHMIRPLRVIDYRISKAYQRLG